MDHFQANGREFLHCEEVSLQEIADKFGTPTYVYSEATLRRHCQALTAAFSTYPTSFFFAMKANSNQSFLRVIKDEGFGCDIVSGGELEKALLSGFSGSKILFSGVGKTREEIRLGMQRGIHSFQVESREELSTISEIAQEENKKIRTSLRVNPDIDAKTNPKITTGMKTSKFGLATETVKDIMSHWQQFPNLDLVGLSCHIGSQLLDLTPLSQASKAMARLATEAQKIMNKPLEFIDMGGGLGIRYDQENPPDVEDYAKAILREIAPTGCKLYLEPGRVLAGNAGALLTRVIRPKITADKSFIIVDAAMSDFMRPALYGAKHKIVEVSLKAKNLKKSPYDVVGAVCESSDVLVYDAELSELKEGDLLLIRGCGAYGYVMSSNYNSRTRPAEVMVAGSSAKLITRREDTQDIWRLEV